MPYRTKSGVPVAVVGYVEVPEGPGDGVATSMIAAWHQEMARYAESCGARLGALFADRADAARPAWGRLLDWVARTRPAAVLVPHRGHLERAPSGAGAAPPPAGSPPPPVPSPLPSPVPVVALTDDEGVLRDIVERAR